MGFLDDVGNWFANITGTTAQKEGASREQGGKDIMGAAATNLGGIAGKTGTQFAQEAGQAGQELGNQMGQEAATQGTQEAMQAARTAGLNKGQAALEGSQQAGKLYTAGQQAGRGMGMNAYGQGAQTQLGGAGAQANLGVQQYEQGANKSQQGAQTGLQLGGAILGGIGDFATGGLNKVFKATGGVVNKPVIAGEAGPEAILPLNDKERTAQILERIGLRKGAAEARGMKCPACGGEMKGQKNGNH